MMSRLFAWPAILLAAAISMPATACELVMGYRTTARLPNIEAAPSNAGLYLDLYTAAAKRIGCTLSVVRAPKNRILNHLQQGKIDFYPGFTFSPERASLFYFAGNGLPSRQVGLTLAGVPPIRDYGSLRGKVLLSAMGGGHINLDKEGVLVRTPPELSIDRAISLIEEEKAFIFVDELSTLSFYLKHHIHRDRFALHPDCCGGSTEFTMGISKKSAQAHYVANPSYDAQQAIRIDNYPTQLSADSRMQQFVDALRQLHDEGFTAKLYRQYYGAAMPELPKDKKK
jgi:hypothetical protein